MNPQLRKAFISSSLGGLPSYRDAVLEAVREAGFEPVMFEPGANEDDTLVFKQGQALTSIVERITQTEVSVFVVGYRYGSPARDAGPGLIEIEYGVALKAGIPLFVFMASENARWPPSAIDLDRSRIEAFRRRLLAEFTVVMFSTPVELSAEVLRALNWHVVRQQGPATKIEPRKEVQKVNIVRLLLSSPGDVAEERDRVARAVFRYNQDAVEERNIFVKLIRWEDMAPQIGPGPQNVINEQIGKYELFLGIMWNRFGTPTDVAASGTREEFDAAVQQWRDNKKPWITFYFCDRPANFTTPEQLRQKELVVRFRQDTNVLGITRPFSSADDFEERVYRDLLRITALPQFLQSLRSAS